jgi:hypothetical protein
MGIAKSIIEEEEMAMVSSKVSGAGKTRLSRGAL